MPHVDNCFCCAIVSASHWLLLECWISVLPSFPSILSFPLVMHYDSLVGPCPSEAKEETAVAVVVDAKIDYPSGDTPLPLPLSSHDARCEGAV